MFSAGSLPAAALVSAVSFLTYYNSLWGGFVFDDHRAILTNDDLDAEKTDVWGLFVNDFWGGHMSRSESHKSYRPLTVLTYRYLNYWFHRLEPFSYHLVNVLLHCAASVLFLFVCVHLLGARKKWPPVYAALLFSVHSIHTEAVSHIHQHAPLIIPSNKIYVRIIILILQIASVVGRAEALACVFFLLSLLCYMRGISHGNGEMLSVRECTKWPLVLLSVLMSSLSMLSKEQGVTVVGVCVSFDVFLNWNKVLGRLSQNRTDIGSLDGQKINIAEINSQQMNHRASIRTSTYISSDNITSSALPHVNGISSRTATSAKKSRKAHSSASGGSEVRNMVQRIGRQNEIILWVYNDSSV